MCSVSGLDYVLKDNKKKRNISDLSKLLQYSDIAYQLMSYSHWDLIKSGQERKANLNRR